MFMMSAMCRQLCRANSNMKFMFLQKQAARPPSHLRHGFCADQRKLLLQRLWGSFRSGKLAMKWHLVCLGRMKVSYKNQRNLDTPPTFAIWFPVILMRPSVFMQIFRSMKFRNTGWSGVADGCAGPQNWIGSKNWMQGRDIPLLHGKRLRLTREILESLGL